MWDLAVEQASTLGWERYVGESGRMIGMKAFGASATVAFYTRKKVISERWFGSEAPKDGWV